MAAEFAEFDDDAHGDPWNVDVRALAPEDVMRVGALFAEREGRTPDHAAAVVASWLSAPHLIVFVAERHGRVVAYAKVEWLDPGAEGGSAPTGWYLAGLVVEPGARRHGVGTVLTEARIQRVAAEAGELWYFANLRNRPTVALHEKLGFVLHSAEVGIPGVGFDGGQGGLFRLSLRAGD